MFKSEPRTILQFLATHFDLLRELFDIQVENELITRAQVEAILEESGSDIEGRLFEHKLLVNQNNDYVINEPYYDLFEFILQRFKPLLPEEIEKYGLSIRQLFLKIKDGIHKDKNILLDRIEALSKEIRKFTIAATNNTISLLNESRELKANRQKIEYREKVEKASYLIDNYIRPLNAILDLNHAQSVYNELLRISRFVNNRRLDYTDESMRRQYEKLYSLLGQSVMDISRQSSILSNELMPLLDRIKTESEYLQGFIHYLTNGNCYKKFLPPDLYSRTRNNPYNPFIYENTREYFEQFKDEEDVFIKEEKDRDMPWIFDKDKYKVLLDAELPVDDFFNWCKDSIEQEMEDYNLDNYFMLTSLIFEEEYEVLQDTEGGRSSLEIDEVEWVFPKLRIRSKENVS